MISKISSTCFGQFLPIFRSVRLRFLRHMVYCPVATWQYVPRCRSPNPCLPQQQDTIQYAVKISVLCSWRWAKDCPKHVELILEINKLLLLHLVGSSILIYLHWWCTVKHISIFSILIYGVILYIHCYWWI